MNLSEMTLEQLRDHTLDIIEKKRANDDEIKALKQRISVLETENESLKQTNNRLFAKMTIPHGRETNEEESRISPDRIKDIYKKKENK